MESAIRFALEPLESRRLLSASIGGTVYNDSNGNHLRDAGENGIAGAQIYLDLNGIDTLVAGDPEATTDANGGYSFNGLSGGNYLVRPVPTANKVTTTPVWGGKYFVQLGANQNVIGDDFGSQVAGSPSFKVNDQLLIAGVSNGKATLARYKTDGSTDVGFGTLGVVTLPSSVTGQPTGAIAQGGNTVITYPSGSVTLSATGVILTSPVVIGGPGISGIVYNDLNSNHQRDAGEAGFAGIQLYLDLNGIDSFVAGDPLATADVNGNYNFTGLNAGNYLVRVMPQTGHITTTPLWGGKYFLQLGAGQNATGNDFGVTSVVTPNFSINGQLLVAGVKNSQATLTRYNADNSTDISFGSLGVVTLPLSVTGQPTAALPQGPNLVMSYPTATVTLTDNGSIVSITSGTSTLNAPTELRMISVSANSAQLAFTDNSTNDQGFIVERSDFANGPWLNVANLSGAIYGASTGLVSYTDPTVQPITSYYYRVYAVAGAVQSNVAGPLFVTTPAVVTSGVSISGVVYGDDNLDGTLGKYEFGFRDQKVYLDLPGIGHYVLGDPVSITDGQGNYSFTGLTAGNYLVRLVTDTDLVISQPLWGGKYFIQLGDRQAVTGKDFGARTASYSWTPSVTQSDGKILVASEIGTSGSPGSRAAISRFNPDRSVDVNFGVFGTERIDTITNSAPPYTVTTILALRSDGYAVVGTLAPTDRNYEFINLVDPTGHTVHSDQLGFRDFNSGDSATLAAFLPTGKIVVAGTRSLDRNSASHRPILLKRYNSDLTPDLTFGTNGLLELTHLEGTVTSVTGAADGSMQIHFTNDTVNLSSAGAIDPARLIAAPTTLVVTGSTLSTFQLQFNDNSTNEQKFVVQRIGTNTDIPDWTNFGTVAGSTDSGQRTFTDSNLFSSTLYTYRAYAVSGAVYSDNTAPVTITKISGTVFDDANENGYLNTGEIGIAGLHVYDPAIPAVSTYTNADGFYSLYIAAASVHLRTGPIAAGRVFTSPVTGSYDFTFGANANTPAVPAIAGDVTPASKFNFIGSGGTITIGGGNNPPANIITANFGTAVPTTPHVTLPNGQVIVASTFYENKSFLIPTPGVIALTRYNIDGTADTSYGTNGVAKITDPSFVSILTPVSLALRVDGSVAVLIEGPEPTVFTPNDFNIGRSTSVSLVSASGQVVRTVFPLLNYYYSQSPIMTFTSAGKLLIVGNGYSIFTAGNALPVVITRLNADFTLDNTFGYAGDNSWRNFSGPSFSDFGNLLFNHLDGTPTAVNVLPDGGCVLTFANDSVMISNDGHMDSSRSLPAPSNMTATGLSSKVVSIQFTDNAATEQFYNIESAVGLQRPRIYPPQDWDWSVKGTVSWTTPTGVRNFDLDDAQPGVFTIYRVRAVNGAVVSDPSTGVSVTTPVA